MLKLGCRLPPGSRAHAFQVLCSESSRLLSKILCAFPAPSCHYHIYHCHRCDTWVRTWLINQTFSGWRDIFKALCEPSVFLMKSRGALQPRKRLVVGLSSHWKGSDFCAVSSEEPLSTLTCLVHHIFSFKEDSSHPPFFPSSTFDGWFRNPRGTLLAFFEILPSPGFSSGVLRRQKHYCHKKRSSQLLSEKADGAKFSPPEEAIKPTQWATSSNRSGSAR